MSKLDAFSEILQKDASASGLTWLRLGGPIEYLARPRSEEELLALLQACAQEGLEVRVLGDGSSLLVADEGVKGVVVQLSEPAFCKISVEAPYVVAGAGVKLGVLATTTATAGLAGIEGLIGVPGVLGGAAATNASTSDVSLGQWVESARVATYDGRIRELSADEIVFGYRSSSLENAIVLSIRFRLEPEPAQELFRRLQKIWIIREQARPKPLSGEGFARMFKNPRGERAAEFIADVDMTKASVGGAKLCDANPNLVTTAPNATSEDVKNLVLMLQEKTRVQLGVDLESELTVWP